MKLEINTLKRIIKEEMRRVISENELGGMIHPSPSEIGLQVFATKRGPFNRKRLEQSLIKGRVPVYSKPMGSTDKPYPAFWTSTLKDTTTGWLDLCRDPDFWEAKAGDEAVIYEILPSAKILVMDSQEDYNKIKKAYSKQTPQGGVDMQMMFGGSHIMGGNMIDVVDWSKLSKDYDAIYCSSNSCYTGWDVESIAWWNLNVLKEIDIVDISKECRLITKGE